MISKALKDPAASYGVLSSDFAKLVADAKILNRLSTELESLTTDEINSEHGLNLLVSIVVTCKQLQSRQGLHIALARCSQSIKSSTEVMTGLITRLSRYYAASTFLLRAATRFPIFSLIEVSPVMIRASKISKTDLDPFAATVIDQLSTRQRGRIPNKVLTTPALKIKEEICHTAMAKSYPVHAEIQLLLHYERHFSNHPPRVISSYKKACYLCSLFFKLHGKFIVPSTHGRLYEKWILPENIETFQVSPDEHICSTLQRFVLAMEEAIRAVVFGAQHRPIQAPYESVIFSSPVWSTAPPTAAQSVTGDQTSVSKETKAVSQSCGNREHSEKAIAARPSPMKSFQKGASSVASVLPPAEAELETCDSVVPLDKHGFQSDVRADSEMGFSRKHETKISELEGVAESNSTSEIDSSSNSNSIHNSLRCSELHAVAGTNPFLEVKSGLETISISSQSLMSKLESRSNHSVASVGNSAINLSSISESTIVPNNTSEAIQCSEPSLEGSSVADSAATFTSAYLPLKLGETISKELSTFMRCFKVGTPRLHIALFYDQATKHWSGDGNYWNNATVPLDVRYRVDVKWLHPDEELKAGPDAPVAVLNSFPRGSQKTLDLQDEGELKNLWLLRGNDLVRVTYSLLKPKRESHVSDIERQSANIKA